MPIDDDGEDRDPQAPLLPPDDRVWRHPSELGVQGGQQQIVLVSRAGPSAWRTIAVAAVAGLVGAAATVAIIAATGTLRDISPGTTAVERIEAQAQRTPGESDLAIADRVLPSIVTVRADGRSGSQTGTGVAFRSDGHIITTADVVDGAEPGSISITLNDGSRLPARLVGRSLATDVAVVKVDRTDLPTAMGATNRARFGSHTVIIDAGTATRAPEISVGFVSSESRSVLRADNTNAFGLVQVTTRDTVTRRGAGTILVNDAGSVVGVVTSKAEDAVTARPPTQCDDCAPTDTGRAGNGVVNHVATPADLVWKVAAQLVDKGQVTTAHLGVGSGKDLSPNEATQFDVAGGVRIDQPLTGSPAQAADLRANDVVVQVGDEPVASFNDLVVAVRHHEPGEQVKVVFLRGGERTTTLVTLEGRVEQT